MAVAPRDSPVTRDQVHGWIRDYNRSKNLPQFKKTLRQYLQGKLNDLDVGDVEIITQGHEDLRDSTLLIDMILMDIDSYG